MDSAKPRSPYGSIAANDTIADEIAAAVVMAKVGSSECAMLQTREIGGDKWVVMKLSEFERTVALARTRERAKIEKPRP